MWIKFRFDIDQILSVTWLTRHLTFIQRQFLSRRLRQDAANLGAFELDLSAGRRTVGGSRTSVLKPSGSPAATIYPHAVGDHNCAPWFAN
jgi:hypothetical protein